MAVEPDRIADRVAILPREPRRPRPRRRSRPSLRRRRRPGPAGPGPGCLGRPRRPGPVPCRHSPSRRLEDQREPERLGRPRPARLGRGPAARGHAGCDAGQKALLSQPVLADPEVFQPGRTVRRWASQRRAGAETFSNSTVTASAVGANARMRGRWSGGPMTDQLATCAAGVSSVALEHPGR